MRKVAILLLSLLLITSITTVFAQEVTPQYLELTVYNDGTVKAIYDVETDPIAVRVDVELFGSSFSNLVVRDDEGLPIEASVQGSTATIDSLGALELNIEDIDFLCFLSATVILRILEEEAPSKQPTSPV